MEKKGSASIIAMVSILMIIAFIPVAMIVLPSPSSAMAPNGRVVSATKVVREMTTHKDVMMVADLVKGSYGVVIMPKFYKAVFGLGGPYGEGLVLQHDPATGHWYGPSYIKISGESYGAEVGGQSTTLFLVITDKQGMEYFYDDTAVELDTNVDLAAGPLGPSTGAETGVNRKASVYSYSMSKGILAAPSLGRLVMKTDGKANESYWGSKYPSRMILGKPASRSNIQPLLVALNNFVLKAGK